jgi:2-polyprenyl-6-methoxyphenol hydroxylase-like FAD-dependent oxidoreductase
MAIESAFTLAACLKEHSQIAAALRAYEAIRQPRTAYVTRQSWQIGRVGQWENRWGCYLRDLLLGFLPDDLMQKRLVQVADYQD